jgi:hypothetical protein
MAGIVDNTSCHPCISARLTGLPCQAFGAGKPSILGHDCRGSVYFICTPAIPTDVVNLASATSLLAIRTRCP